MLGILACSVVLLLLVVVDDEDLRMLSSKSLQLFLLKKNLVIRNPIST